MTTREGYNAYLHATLRARGATEARLDTSAASSVYPLWPARKISDLLAHDLADLGDAPAPALPNLTSPSALAIGGIWGTLYVLEGSAVGARLLLRQAEGLGMTAQFGARHLAAQTSQPVAWKTFIDLLDGADLTPAQDADCVKAARSTFEAFEQAYIEMSQP